MDATTAAYSALSSAVRLVASTDETMAVTMDVCWAGRMAVLMET